MLPAWSSASWSCKFRTWIEPGAAWSRSASSRCSISQPVWRRMIHKYPQSVQITCGTSADCSAPQLERKWTRRSSLDAWMNGWRGGRSCAEPVDLVARWKVACAGRRLFCNGLGDAAGGHCTVLAGSGAKAGAAAARVRACPRSLERCRSKFPIQSHQVDPRPDWHLRGINRLGAHSNAGPCKAVCRLYSGYCSPS